MAEERSGVPIAVLSSTWGNEHDEVAFVIRNLAGAISRFGAVSVLVPGRPGPPRADGAFDLVPVGEPAAGRWWPDPQTACWPESHTPAIVLIDRPDQDLLGIVRRFVPGVPIVAVGAGTTVPDGTDALWQVGTGPFDPGASVYEVGLHVPINPLAAKRRHNGLGFTDYVLVLGDRRPGLGIEEPPSPLVRWLVSRFPRNDVVVVENAVASAWRSRSLRGRVTVDTRTDLWRLVAHALVVVDLLPGPLVARECVESLRFGTPVVVPAGTAAASLAASGGGLWYEDVAELLACVDAFSDRQMRDTLGAQGRAVAEARYGSPERFVDRVRVAMRQWQPDAPGGRHLTQR